METRLSVLAAATNVTAGTPHQQQGCCCGFVKLLGKIAPGLK
jgi:hypothetical protein